MGRRKKNLDNILQIKGNVKFPITLDPGVWIFDDRRVDLHTYFHDLDKENIDELTAYKIAISKHWDREIIEGSSIKPTSSQERKYEREKVLTGTFGIPLKPFLMNAEPSLDAKIFVIKLKDQKVEMSLEEAYNLILGFSNNGKPLIEDGPVHIYYGDGSNQNNPFKNIKEFEVK